MTEKVYDETNCVWREKLKCSFEEKAKEDKLLGEFKCDDNCDFATLKFDKEAILERISFERHRARKLFLFCRERKKRELMDSCIGIVKMKEVLEKFFGVENDLKRDLEIAMTEFDRARSIIGKGF